MTEMIKEAIINIFMWIWDGCLTLGYWYVCLSSIVSVCLYAVSKDKKFIQYVGVAIVFWIFMKGFDSVI